MNNLPAPPGYRDVIVRAAADPNFDIDKLERLVAMQEAQEQRAIEQAFTSAHSDAEAEMETIRADANNPQTRSRYATFARLDREARPIYTKHGFGISFTTEPMSTPDNILVVGTLSHRNGFSKRYQLPVPITTVGIKGTQMMTPVHAMMSAVSYGKRNLEIMMFNLQVGDDDDDGNRAGGGGGRRPPPMGATYGAAHDNSPAPRDIIDETTGEVTSTKSADKISPCKIAYADNDDWRTWGEKLMWGIRTTTTLSEVDAWCALNAEKLERMGIDKPVLFKTLMNGIAAQKDKIFN